MKSLQKEQIAQITQYEPQSAGINLQSPQTDSTPWTLTLGKKQKNIFFLEKKIKMADSKKVHFSKSPILKIFL